MSDIKGTKELEERREKFYSVQGHGKWAPFILIRKYQRQIKIGMFLEMNE